MELSEIVKLSVEERLDLCGKIRSTIAPEDYAVYDWQVRMVRAALEAFRRDGNPGVPAIEALHELRSRIRRD